MNELMRRILFLPEQGSAYASQVDHLHYFVILMTMLGVFWRREVKAKRVRGAGGPPARRRGAPAGAPGEDANR